MPQNNEQIRSDDIGHRPLACRMRPKETNMAIHCYCIPLQLAVILTDNNNKLGSLSRRLQ